MNSNEIVSSERLLRHQTLHGANTRTICPFEKGDLWAFGLGCWAVGLLGCWIHFIGVCRYD